MRKILLSIVICLAFSFIASSQSILGQWYMEMNEDDYTLNLGFNFESGGRVSMFINGYSEIQNLVTIYVYASVTGKYESKGKSLGIRFNNDAKTSVHTKLSDSLSPGERSDIEQGIKMYLPDIEKEMARKIRDISEQDFCRQIIQVNDEQLVLKFPGTSTDTFYRKK